MLLILSTSLLLYLGRPLQPNRLPTSSTSQPHKPGTTTTPRPMPAAAAAAAASNTPVNNISVRRDLMPNSSFLNHAQQEASSQQTKTKAALKGEF